MKISLTFMECIRVKLRKNLYKTDENKYLMKYTYFICLTIVLLPDSPAPVIQNELELQIS